MIVGWKGRDEPWGIDTQYMRLSSREVIPELEWWSVTRLRGEKWRDEGGRQGYMRHIRDSWKYVSHDRSGTERKSRVSSSTAELPLQLKSIFLTVIWLKSHAKSQVTFHWLNFVFLTVTLTTKSDKSQRKLTLTWLSSQQKVIKSQSKVTDYRPTLSNFYLTWKSQKASQIQSKVIDCSLTLLDF